MSEEGHEGRHRRLYIQDMIEFGENAYTLPEDLNQDAFVAKDLNYDTTLHNIELIGEAATHIPGEARDAHPEIQWRRIVGAGNHEAHALLGLDVDVIWDIVRTEIPRLLPALCNLPDTAGEGPRER